MIKKLPDNRPLSKQSISHTTLSLFLAILFVVINQPVLSAAIGDFGDNPDPHVAVFDGKYWIYPTAKNDATTGAYNQDFHAFSSTDLVDWTDEGIVLDITPYNVDRGWAPAVAFKNGTYYFYNSVYVNGAPHHPSTLYVTTSTTPDGPFGNPTLLATSSASVEAIDPMVFTDDDNRSYIYYGGSWGSQLVMHELNGNMVSLVSSTPTTVNVSHYTEAPFVHKRGGTYYLSYSNGQWDCTDGVGCTLYNVQYATSTSPTGPWTHQGTLLQSNSRYKSPGHHSIVQRPGSDEWFIVYHRWDSLDLGIGRQISIEKLEYNTNGTLKPVIMTHDGITVAKKPELPSDTYKIVSKQSGKALDMLFCQTDDNTNIIQYDYWGGDCQQWDVTKQTDGSYTIFAKGTAQSLDRHNCSVADNTNVKLYQHWGGDPCQRWNIIPSGDNAFKIVAKDNNHQGLDVDGCSINNGANIKMYGYWGGDCQRWRFEQP